MPNVSTNIRINDEVKKQSSKIFNNLGLDMSTAVNIFLRQTIRHNGLPFDIKLDKPNHDTLEAIKEVELMKQSPDDYKSYSDIDALMEDLLK